MSISVEFKNRFNDIIDEVVTERHLKKSDLPKLMGIDYSSFVNALEYGIIPTPRITTRIADFVNCSIPYFLGTSDDEYFSKSKKNESLADRINLLCEEKGVNYSAVCKACNFYRGYLSRWIKEHYIPSWEFIEILADYFNVSIDYLLGRTDDKN